MMTRKAVSAKAAGAKARDTRTEASTVTRKKTPEQKVKRGKGRDDQTNNIRRPIRRAEAAKGWEIVNCPNCRGTGTRRNKPCPLCHGDGKIKACK